jgi:hypothetical protein
MSCQNHWNHSVSNMVSAPPQAVETCVVGHHRKYAFSLSLTTDMYAIVIDRCRTKVHSSSILKTPSRKRRYEVHTASEIYLLSHITASSHFSRGLFYLNISAKIKTTISEVKVLWVNEDKRNVIICKLFINKLKDLCRVYCIGLIIKFPTKLSERRILIPEVTFSFWNINVRDILSSKTVFYHQGWNIAVVSSLFHRLSSWNALST